MKEIAKKIKSFKVLTVEEPVSEIERPEVLDGKTYKIKLPDFAMYVTINDLNGKPYEIFVESKNLDHFQWVKALTRLASMALREGCPASLVAQEMKEIHDGLGGRLKKGGGRHNSIVAQIGDILEQHANVVREVSEYVSAKKGEEGVYDNATICPKCNAKAVVRKDNCSVCLECSDSACS